MTIAHEHGFEAFELYVAIALKGIWPVTAERDVGIEAAADGARGATLCIGMFFGTCGLRIFRMPPGVVAIFRRNEPNGSIELMRLFAILLALLPSLVLAETLTGVASVVDGDILEIHGERIRLHGIDAPESAQRCRKPDGSQWRCGQKAALALADRIGQQTVRCEGKERNRYGHLVAACYHKGQDLSAWMVLQGWALAHRRYGRGYISQEQQAKTSRAGIWSGAFIVPWEWGSHRRGEDATNDKGYPDFGHQGEAGRFTQPR